MGEMIHDSIYHIISWIFHKSKRPGKSVPEAEIFAFTEGIDEGKTISIAYSDILGM